MTLPKRTYQLRPTKGYSSDTPPSELTPDYWGGTIRNVIMRGGLARRVLGSRDAYSVTGAFHALNARGAPLSPTTNWWLTFSADTVTARETSNTYDVTPVATLTTVDKPWRYSSTLLSNIPVFTNSFDAPQYWYGNNATPFATLPDWPAGTVCRSIVAFKNHLIALNLSPGTGYEDQVLVSGIADPGAVPDTWTPAADNEADAFQISDQPGPIQMGVALRGSLIVYKRSSTYALDYIENSSGPGEFGVRTLFTSSGALTSRAAVDLNGQHLVVTDGDIILTDGSSRRSIGEARMRDFLFRTIDSDNYESLYAVHNRAKGEVLIAFPEGGQTDCTLGLVYDIGADSFGVRELTGSQGAAVGVVNDTAADESWNGSALTWDTAAARLWNQSNFSLATESLIVIDDGALVQQDTGDAVTLDSVIGRHHVTFEEPDRVKAVRRVHVRAEAGFGTLYVKVGSSMTAGGTITWDTERTLTEDAPSVPVRATGKFISVEVRHQGSEPWRLMAVDFEYEARGYR